MPEGPFLAHATPRVLRSGARTPPSKTRCRQRAPRDRRYGRAKSRLARKTERTGPMATPFPAPQVAGPRRPGRPPGQGRGLPEGRSRSTRLPVRTHPRSRWSRRMAKASGKAVPPPGAPQRPCSRPMNRLAAAHSHTLLESVSLTRVALDDEPRPPSPGQPSSAR